MNKTVFLETIIQFSAYSKNTLLQKISFHCVFLSLQIMGFKHDYNSWIVNIQVGIQKTIIYYFENWSNILLKVR